MTGFLCNSGIDVLNFLVNIRVPAAICLTLGFLLVIVEMFHPGFGVPGITGAILLILGVIFTATSIFQALEMVLIILALLGIALAIVLQSATKGKLSKKLILFEKQKKESGYIGTEDLDYFIEKEGKAETVLRPSGTADFSGVKMDVVTQGEFIDKGSKIKVIKVQGIRIIVKEVNK